MEYRIDNKKVRIYPQHLEEIGRGCEGIVYKYAGKVLKLYHDYPKKGVLSFQNCEYMTKLNTERVLLPNQSVTDKHHFMRGYTIFPYINDEIDIYEITGKIFLQERELIQLELIYLGENFISVDDFCLNNFKFSDKFYLLDPGSYQVQWNMMTKDIEQNMIYLANMNVETFDTFLYEKIFLNRIRQYINNLEFYRDFLTEFQSNYRASGYGSKMDYVSKFILPDISLNESIKQMVKSHKN